MQVNMSAAKTAKMMMMEDYSTTPETTHILLFSTTNVRYVFSAQLQ